MEYIRQAMEMTEDGEYLESEEETKRKMNMRRPERIGPFRTFTEYNDYMEAHRSTYRG
jgi:hypothetical protein